MINYRYCTSIQEIENYIYGAKEVAFDFETSPINPYRQEGLSAINSNKSEIIGISLSVKEGTSIYIPLKHKIGINADFKEILTYLRERLFLNESMVKIAHNLSFEAAFLYKYGIIIQEPVYDTMVASQMTLKCKNEFRKLYDSGLKSLALELFNEELPTFNKIVEGKHFDELHPNHEKTIKYACSDSDYTLRLYNIFNLWFRSYMPSHEEIVRSIESPIAIYVGLMKHSGIGVNKELMKEKKLEAEEKLKELKEKITTLAGRKIKIGANASTDEFKRFLYVEHGLPKLKTTQSFKESLDEEAIILLKEWCQINKPKFVEFLDIVLEYRKWSKLKSTYIEGFIDCINSCTGRIHGDFFPLGTDTGRFSSSRPNLQNMPRKGNDPIGIRNFFSPGEGKVLVSFDFSQIELRVGAFYCRDEKMLRTYEEGGDIHGATTSVIYNIPFEEAVDKDNEFYKERRTIAKNCNFGVFYGLFPKGLQKTLRFKAGRPMELWQCEKIINNLKRGYPKLVSWQRETIRIARVKEFAITALGRRRYLKDIKSNNWGLRAYWERCALNTPIQGTAADILKIAMVNILKEIKKHPYIVPVLQIHDEIVFEIPDHKLQEAMSIIKEVMERKPFPKFDVPIVAEGAVGKSFGEMEEI